ncbi:transposase family protein [Streptomyces mirabilis]|uniref:transposase family protein n=1 Tax=Streptomyces mirabilis TaxID=68239 RepID=UPI00379D6212
MSRPRKRAVGAGAKHRLVFVDRLLATLVHLRHGATHDVLACWWSTRTLADHLKRREGISVSWHYVARIWREENLKPHRSGTFKISKDPAFAEKVADVVGLHLAPPGGAVVLSIDEKTQVQALDRTHQFCR